MPIAFCIRLQNAVRCLNDRVMAVADHMPALRAGIIVAPDFTMLALSAFVDTLRLAADERDRGRQINCAWRLMSSDGHRVSASNGIVVEPTSGLIDPGAFDYLVVVGGTLHRMRRDTRLDEYLQKAARQSVPLVGLCTGSFYLARAGLMDGYKACVSWLHRDELIAQFPRVRAVADALFVFDRDRITCAGGTGVIHLASHLVDRHLGRGASEKGLRIMLEDRMRSGTSPQPPPAMLGIEKVCDPRVRRAMLLIERSIDDPLPPTRLASTLGISARQLNRLFNGELGCSLRAFERAMRLERAERLVTGDTISMTEIATACGFSDAAHFSRAFRGRFRMPPSEARRRARVDQR